MGKATNKTVERPVVKSSEKEVKCKCGHKLKEANFSKVRLKYFCPVCIRDYSEEELK